MANLNYYPALWGPEKGLDSKDYILHMEHPVDGPTGQPVNLLGHALTSPAQNLSDALQVTQVRLRGGKVIPITRVKRPAQELSRTYTVGFPSHALWSPLQQRAFQQIIGCQSDLYLIYPCPEDRIYSHWQGLRNATINPPIESTDVITNNEDTNMIERTSEIQVEEVVWGWELGFLPVYAGTDEMYAITFLNEDCAGCDFSVDQGLLAVGGNGTDALVSLLTDDRFGSAPTALTTGLTVTNVIASVFNEGDLIVVSALDDPDIVTATAGQLAVSSDRGVTWKIIAGFTDGITKVVQLGGLLIAVGSDFTDGVIWVSTDKGSTWTEVDSTALTTIELTNAAVDSVTGKVYMVSATGELLVARPSGGGLSVSDLTANIPGAPASLAGVCVLRKDHLVIAGAAGYLAESRDGGVTWAQPNVPTSAAILKVVGTVDRTAFITAANIYQRNPMTNQEFKLVTLESGLTVSGNYTDLVMGRNDFAAFNYFAACTDAGEVVIGTPFYPNA